MDTKTNQLVIFDTFKRLREWYKLSLGIDDYLLAFDALTSGFEIGNLRKLEVLCCTIWSKSEEEVKIISRVLNEVLQQYSLPTSIQDTDFPIKLLQKNNNSSQNKTLIPKRLTPKENTSFNNDYNPEPNNNYPFQDAELDKDNAMEGEDIENLFIRDIIANYIPVTMEQSTLGWRRLLNLITAGQSDELDISKTLESLFQQGAIIDLTFKPYISNDVELFLLIDQDGSMVPFHPLTRQLVESARCIRRLRVYYFHDFPDIYLYRHPALLNAALTSEILTYASRGARVLIVSDAGAARGYYDNDRVSGTKKFIDMLKNSSHLCAWLNPIPGYRWSNTSAREINKTIQMFEMSKQGLSKAIDVLLRR